MPSPARAIGPQDRFPSLVHEVERGWLAHEYQPLTSRERYELVLFFSRLHRSRSHQLAADGGMLKEGTA
ncbi:hypothetical protein ACIBUY_28140 [Streptomyces sp. NPDC050085]|uniref:hypothetical protein n=1 Tax=Streptomyces sp. NPDC050085 TaxID=3365600 RepID=UPI00379C6BAF